MNKKEEKFKFVSVEEFSDLENQKEEVLEDDVILKSGEVEGALDEMQIVKDAHLDELKLTSDDNKIDDLEKETNNSDFENSIKIDDLNERRNFSKDFYIGFETRIMIAVFVIVFFFLGACYFVFEACNYGRNHRLTYNEKSVVDYKVCVDSSTYYNDSCIGEDLQYLSYIARNIPVTFKYGMKISEEIDYQLSYNIVGVVKIYDKQDKKKVFYENEEILAERVDISDKSDKFEIEKQIRIDFQDYNEYVNGYKNKYGLDLAADLEVILYLNEKEKIRNVASLKIPLGEESFGIVENLLPNSTRKARIGGDTWTDYNVMCAVVASIFIIISLLVLFRTTRLVLKATTTKSKYEIELAHILKTYDSLIVNTRDGYNINPEKEVIKVESFKELADASKVLSKPIMYSKINSVKSEFVVEDIEKIYRYVLKEADIK